MSITSNVTLDENKRPSDPWSFAKTIEASQPRNLPYKYPVLFNKGKYFEISIYDTNLLIEISSLINEPIQYNNMIVSKWDKLEDFVIAMNIMDYYVEIEIDWI